MIKIGDKELVYSSSLIIPEGEQAYVSFTLGNWKINLRINFLTTGKNNDEQGVVWQTVDNTVHIDFINWNNSLGTAIAKHSKFGETDDGRELSFLANHWLIGTTRRLDIQFLLGEKA